MRRRNRYHIVVAGIAPWLAKPVMLGGLVTNYIPQRIDTSRITLTADIENLVETLAQNNHDHWAQQRIDEGWRYGPRRDDSKKEHPDLVPYDQLSASEKEYDRRTVVEALKAIIALGYEVRKGA